jgi:hypothetical protein
LMCVCVWRHLGIIPNTSFIYHSPLIHRSDCLVQLIEVMSLFIYFTLNKRIFFGWTFFFVLNSTLVVFSISKRGKLRTFFGCLAVVCGEDCGPRGRKSSSETCSPQFWQCLRRHAALLLSFLVV